VHEVGQTRCGGVAVRLELLRSPPAIALDGAPLPAVESVEVDVHAEHADGDEDLGLEQAIAQPRELRRSSEGRELRGRPR